MMPRIRYQFLTVLLLAAFFSTSCTILDDILAGLAELCELDTYVVTKTDDTNDGVCTADDCSLREAVRQANACAGHQTIQLQAGGYHLTRLGPDEDAALTGDLDITDDLTILGEGVPSIHGEDSDRIFEVFDPAEVLIDLVIMTEGREQGGGAVRNHGYLTISNSSINNNAAVVPPGGGGSSGGGGIFNEFRTLTLIDTQIFDNTADSGAGIHNFATANLVMQGGRISFNTANDDAGGLWVNVASQARLENVFVEGNIAGASSSSAFPGKGGGIYNAGRLELVGSDIARNTAGEAPDAGGGGIHVIDVSSDPVFDLAFVSMDDTRIFDNIGGGIVNNGVVEMTDSSVLTNTSSSGLFPGISNNVEMSIDSSLISGNQVSGLVNGRDGMLTVVDTTIADNFGGNGAGMINSGTASIARSTFQDNVATGSGGGIEIQGGTLELTNVTVSRNRGVGAGGGIISAISGGGSATLVLANSTVAENTPDGVFDAFGVIELEGSIIANNSGVNCGGGLMTSNGSNMDSDGSCPLGAAGDLSGVMPGLAGLSLNGGPTLTHALLPGSPALDALLTACPGEDQRGVSRPQGVACDIGAFELESGDSGAVEPVETESPEPAGAPMGTFTSNAFCRQGPSTAFPEVRTYNQGQQVALDARNSQSTWSRVLDDQCWASNGVLDIEGPYEELPVIDVPLPEVTPTPSATPTEVVAIPDEPANLTVSNIICSSQQYEVTLSWALSAGADGYRVYRDGGLIATLGANATSYADDLPDFEAHEWGVEAFNSAGTSDRPIVSENGCVF